MAGWLPLFKQPEPEKRVVQLESGTFVFGGAGGTITASPFPASFGLETIVERLAEDPEYYRRMASHLASEIGFAVQKLEGQTGNSVEIIRGELVRLQEGFAQLSQSLAEKAFEKAAAVVVGLRDGLADWCASHPELVDTLQKIAVIGFGTIFLHQVCGIEPSLSGLIAYSVVQRDKLSDVSRGSKEKKGTDGEGT